MKCLVRTCPNDDQEGTFKGNLCQPCAWVLEGKERAHSAAAQRIIASALNMLPVHTTTK